MHTYINTRFVVGATKKLVVSTYCAINEFDNNTYELRLLHSGISCAIFVCFDHLEPISSSLLFQFLPHLFGHVVIEPIDPWPELATDPSIFYD